MAQRLKRISDTWKAEIDNLYDVVRVQRAQIDELKAKIATLEGQKK
jgi:hypothetical protein